MFAEARLQWHRPWLIGTPAERQACIREVVLKSGKSGSLAFVTFGLRFIQNGALCIEEEQDIVYREPGGPVTAPVAAPWPPVPEGSWTRVRQPDSRHIELVLQSGSLEDLLPRLRLHALDLVLSNRRVHADADHPWR